MSQSTPQSASQPVEATATVKTKQTGTHLRLCARPGCAAEVGVDEVARGCLFGRVYAAAVWWGDVPLPDEMPKGIVIRDSKKMSVKQRERAAAWIRERARAYAISFRTERFVDERNILVAAQEAMRAAVLELARTAEREPDHIIVDGDRFATLVLRDGAVPFTCEPKADGTYLSVACASILAKVEHGKYVRELCATYPALQRRYGLLSNMGYGSARHMAGIQEHGVSQFHRRTFGCCAEAALRPVRIGDDEEGEGEAGEAGYQSGAC